MKRSLLATVGAVVLVATLGPAIGDARPAPADPWHDTSYTPQPDQWQPYVLAPHDRTLAPVAAWSDGTGPADPGNVLRGRTVRIAAGDRLVLDFGKEVGGAVHVDIAGTSTPAPTLHACYSESRQFMALHPQDNNGEAAHAPGCDTANIWNGYPGTAYTYDSDSHALTPGGDDTALRGGFRYVTLFLAGSGWADVRGVSVHFDAAPEQADPAAYQGWFLSSDNTLNKIWYAGAYTVQLDTWPSNTAKGWPYQAGETDHADAQVPGADPQQEVIFDGAKRDRIVWQGDLAVQAPVTYLSTGDVPAVDNSLSSLAGQQLPDGYVPAESLVGQHNRDEIRTYGEYVTWFVNNHYEHWLYTGDRAYLDRWWPALTKAMAWLESVRAQDPLGLIGFGNVGSCGHYGYSDCGHEAYVNALYARNLDQMAALAKARGDDPSAYGARAAAVKAAINAQLWDAKVGAYRLSREIPSAYPQDANAAAVLAGVADPQQASSAMAYLRRTSWSRFGALTVAPGAPNASIHPFYEPMPSGFESSARLELTDPLAQQGSFDLMRTFWGYQLSQDPNSTFPEKLDLNGQPGIAQFTSLAHGWAAAPTTILTTQVLGVTPTDAGFASYDVVPHPGDLTWAQGKVPTPHGAITASWQARSDGFALTVDAPAGTTGRLAVPTGGGPVRVTLDGQPVPADAQDGYVYVSGVGAGHHDLRATRLAPVPTTVDVVATPDAQSVQPGTIAHVTAAVTGRAAGRLTGTVTAGAPDGWTVQPGSTSLDLASDGHPVSQSVDLYAWVPPDTKSGSYPIPITVTAGGATAHTTATVSLSVSTTQYGFEDGPDGWQPAQNVSSVARVTSFADGPGRCQQGSGCLEAAGPAVAASAVRSVFVAPAQPLDLTAAHAFTGWIDCYGGAPGASGYEAVVTLTGAGGQTLTKNIPISNDTWNQLSVDISAWAPRSAVSRIEIGFHALGSTTAWTPRFQIDSVGWTS